MVHGELARGKRRVAVVATAAGQLTLPPLGLSEFPGLVPLLLYFNVSGLRNKWVQTGYLANVFS